MIFKKIRTYYKLAMFKCKILVFEKLRAYYTYTFGNLNV